MLKSNIKASVKNAKGLSLKQNTASWLSLAVEASSCGITIADATKKNMPLIYVNQAFMQMTGYQAKEVLGKNCRFLQGKNRKQAAVKDIAKALKAQKPCVAQLENFRKDGTRFWNELRLAPVFDEANKLAFYIGVQTNITESVALNATKEQYRKELEHQVLERTESLEKKNIALTEVLGQLGIEKQKMNSHILENVDSILIPMAQKIKSKLAPKDQAYADLLIQNLEQMTSPFGAKITRKLFNLTPKEIEICNLIRSGVSTKEIAELNHISISTVENQRNQIRKKLGISKQNTNLTTYLQGIDKE